MKPKSKPKTKNQLKMSMIDIGITIWYPNGTKKDISMDENRKYYYKTIHENGQVTYEIMNDSENMDIDEAETETEGQDENDIDSDDNDEDYVDDDSDDSDEDYVDDDIDDDDEDYVDDECTDDYDLL